jgi:hypothetical protein
VMVAVGGVVWTVTGLGVGVSGCVGVVYVGLGGTVVWTGVTVVWVG